jgi:hypothetical protein
MTIEHERVAFGLHDAVVRILSAPCRGPVAVEFERRKALMQELATGLLGIVRDVNPNAALTLAPHVAALTRRLQATAPISGNATNSSPPIVLNENNSSPPVAVHLAAIRRRAIEQRHAQGESLARRIRMALDADILDGHSPHGRTKRIARSCGCSRTSVWRVLRRLTI